MSGSGPNDIWAVGDGGTALHWDGHSWAIVPTQSRLNLVGVVDFGPASALAVGDDATVRWDGTAWWGLSGGAWANLTTAPTVLWASGPDAGWGAAGRSLVFWDGWEWLDRYEVPGCVFPDGSSQSVKINSIWGSSASDVWAVGECGTVLHFDGQLWSAVSNVPLAQGSENDPTNVSAVWGSGADDVWVMASTATLHWDGTSWAQRPGPSSDAVAYWANSPTDAWAVGGATPGGAPYYGTASHWDGSTWTAFSVPPDAQPFFAVWGSGPADVWAVGMAGTLAHWDGTAWSSYSERVTMTDVGGIWGSGPDDVWAVGYNVGGWGSPGNNVFHWDGSTWTAWTIGPWYVQSVWGTGPTDVWAGGGGLYHWDGTSWSAVDPGPYGVYGFWGSSASDIWAAGRSSTGGVVLHFDGFSWSKVYSGTNDLFAVWGSSPQDIWVVGDCFGCAIGSTGSVGHWNGATWSEVSCPISSQLTGIWGSGPNDVWAVGPSDVVHWDGTAWSRAGDGIGNSQNIGNVWGTAADDVWAAGSSNGALLHWDGKAWSLVYTPSGDMIAGVWASGQHDVWAAGLFGSVVRLTVSP